MTPESLRELQTPLKEEFRENPESAQATLIAQGGINLGDITCQIPRGGPVPSRMGLHPMTGGDGGSACAAELLLESLVGCAGVTFAAVCTSLEIPIEKAAVIAEGDIDFRGTLGVNREVPVGFEAVRLQFIIESIGTEEELNKAVELAERYCVVAQSLKSVSVGWERMREEEE